SVGECERGGGGARGAHPCFLDSRLLLGAVVLSRRRRQRALVGGWSAAVWSPDRPLAAAAIGGLLMGWGARLGFGCNIGAFVGGVASGSVHGWVWFAAALAGCSIGIRLRPWFGLAN